MCPERVAMPEERRGTVHRYPASVLAALIRLSSERPMIDALVRATDDFSKALKR